MSEFNGKNLFNGRLSEISIDKKILDSIKNPVTPVTLPNYIGEQNRQLQKISEDAYRRKEEERQWLKNIAENTEKISLNTDKLIFSIDDLIQSVEIGSKITEANLAIIENQLEKLEINIKENSKVNVFGEIEKTVIALATQSGAPVAFTFLLKVLGKMKDTQ